MVHAVETIWSGGGGKKLLPCAQVAAGLQRQVQARRRHGRQQTGADLITSGDAWQLGTSADPDVWLSGGMSPDKFADHLCDFVPSILPQVPLCSSYRLMICCEDVLFQTTACLLALIFTSVLGTTDAVLRGDRGTGDGGLQRRQDEHLAPEQRVQRSSGSSRLSRVGWSISSSRDAGQAPLAAENKPHRQHPQDVAGQTNNLMPADTGLATASCSCSRHRKSVFSTGHIAFVSDAVRTCSNFLELRTEGRLHAHLAMLQVGAINQAPQLLCDSATFGRAVGLITLSVLQASNESQASERVYVDPWISGCHLPLVSKQ